MQKLKFINSVSLFIVIFIGVLVNYSIYQLTTDYAGPITATILAIVCTYLLSKMVLSGLIMD